MAQCCRSELGLLSCEPSLMSKCFSSVTFKLYTRKKSDPRSQPHSHPEDSAPSAATDPWFPAGSGSNPGHGLH